MYDAEIAYLDDQIRSLLENIQRSRQSDKLLIVVASDHGEEFMEHSGLKHGQSLYEELTRCPLILSGFNIESSPHPVDEWVQNIDIVPTILDLAGIPIPSGVEGISLRPPLRDNRAHSPAFSEIRGFALRRGDWKLWEKPDGEKVLFDLRSDPREQTDLSQTLPDTLSWLSQELEAVKRGLTRPEYPLNDTEISTMDSETVRLLRVLGYME